MISRHEALAAILDRARPRAPEAVPLGAAAGRVLAAAITADRDQPPFDASAMDGYAVRSADASRPGTVLAVRGRVLAGDPRPDRPVGPGEAYQIMTGAPLPDGADAVVMVERTEAAGEGRVRIAMPAEPGRHIRRQGEASRAGDLLLREGMLLGPAEVGVLATVGRMRVLVGSRPRVALLSTGDEIVPPEQAPAPHQIRNSNGAMLAALTRRAGGRPGPVRLVGDRMDDLRDAIREALASDVLVAAGGVSMGEADLVGEAFLREAVEPVFHRVAIKPGKPLWFGHRDDTLVFGVPGNPVSAFLCFLLFVEPALRRMAGAATATPPRVTVRLEGTLRALRDREAYYPARLESGPEGLAAYPMPSTGSGDLAAMAGADLLVAVPPGQAAPGPGDRLEALLLTRS